MDDVPRGVQEQFRIRGAYAVGDTGTLFLAEDMRSQRSGVLKVLRLRPDAGRAARERLAAELSSQASLHAGPSLGTPVRTGVDGGIPWLFRDWVDGESLKSRLARAGELAMAEALVVTAQVASALDVLHRKGLAHRAVRPGHILLQTDGTGTLRAVLIDAGMAGRNDRDSAFEDLGDLFYMPPECSRGEKVTFRTDLYALGCVLYDALFGEPPFDGDEAEEVVYGHLYVPPVIPRDRLPGTVAELLEGLLAKLPADRPMSAQQVLRDLEPFLPEDWREPAAPAPSPVPRTGLQEGVKRATPVPPPAVSLAAMRPSRPPPPPLPPRPEAKLPPPAALPSVIVEPSPETAYGGAWEVAGTTDLSSIAPTEVLYAPPPKRGRLPTLTVGFLVGCLATAGATWGLARSGNFQLLTDTLTTHLAVPPSMLAPAGAVRTQLASEPSVATTPEAPPPTATDDESVGAPGPEGTAALGDGEDAAIVTAEGAVGALEASSESSPSEATDEAGTPEAGEGSTIASATAAETSPAEGAQEDEGDASEAEGAAVAEEPTVSAEAEGSRRPTRAERRRAARAERRARREARIARRRARIQERYRERHHTTRRARGQRRQTSATRTGLLL